MPSSEYPRQFIKPKDKLDNWSGIEPYFDNLRDRPVDSVETLERWLVDYSELMAAIDEVGTDRYIKMTCATDDEDRKKAYLDYIKNISPKVKPRAHELNVKYSESPAAHELPTARYCVLDRGIRASVDIFREENVALQVEEAQLEQKYQEICGAQTVEFEGKEQTLQQLGLYAERTDRDLRQRAWEAEANRRLEDADALEEVFDALVKLRHQMALNADCENYREYAFKSKQRFDYTPQDCLAFHEAIEKAVVPLFRGLQNQRREVLGVDPLRPWDLSVDVQGRDPLRPFETVDQLCSGVSKIFHRIEPDLGAQFDEMNLKGYLDLESRKGKAPGGYQSTYEESRHPFIFMNAVGLQSDVSTLLHEGGHAFHQYAARHDSLLPYRSSPIEFAEVASFTMELLGLEHLDVFYNDEAKGRAQRKRLEGVMWIFPWVATIDAFQHYLYTNPEHSREDRKAHWLKLIKRFGGISDYTGYEDARAYAWHRQLHLFEVPFYYIEYGIAKLGALQVWRNSMEHTKSAIEAYRAGLALGGSKPLPSLFEAAGARFDFTMETVAPLMELVNKRLAQLPQ